MKITWKNLCLVHFYFLDNKGLPDITKDSDSEILHEICSSEDVFFVIIDQEISEFILG